MTTKNAFNWVTIISTIYLIAAGIGSAVTVRNNLINHSGWIIVSYAAVGAIFIVLSIIVIMQYFSAFEKK